MEIKTNYSGFLNDASFAHHINFDEYKSKFEGAEQLIINLKGVSPDSISKDPSDTILFSDDGKLITINYETFEAKDKRGVRTAPFFSDVYNAVKRHLDKAVKQYAKQFPKKD